MLYSHLTRGLHSAITVCTATIFRFTVYIRSQCDHSVIDWKKLPSIELGPTALAWPMTLTLTYDLDLRSPMVMTYPHAIGQWSVGSEHSGNKRTDGRTDRRTKAIALPRTLMRSVTGQTVATERAVPHRRLYSQRGIMTRLHHCLRCCSDRPEQVDSCVHRGRCLYVLHDNR